MKLMRYILPIAVVSAGFLATTIPATGTMELAKKEKTSCKTCHVNVKNTKESHDLNAVGTCYQKGKDLGKCKS